MSRLYADQIAVEAEETADGAYPKTFLWRGGRYRVRQVLARWVEASPWWRDSAYQLQKDRQPTRKGQLSRGRSSNSSRSTVRVATDVSDERWVWRVEASGPVTQSGVYDLCNAVGGLKSARDSHSGPAWFLMRTLD